MREPLRDVREPSKEGFVPVRLVHRRLLAVLPHRDECVRARLALDEDAAPGGWDRQDGIGANDPRPERAVDRLPPRKKDVLRDIPAERELPERSPVEEVWTDEPDEQLRERDEVLGEGDAVVAPPGERQLPAELALGDREAGRCRRPEDER